MPRYTALRAISRKTAIKARPGHRTTRLCSAVSLRGPPTEANLRARRLWSQWNEVWMPALEEKILAAIGHKNYTPLKLKALARKLAVPKSKYHLFKETVAGLVG